MKNVDQEIEELKAKNKGDYIVKGVAFNKNSKRQMEMLKFVLENGDAFSGFIKELIAFRMQEFTPNSASNGLQGQIPSQHTETPHKPNTGVLERPRVKDLGNFI